MRLSKKQLGIAAVAIVITGIASGAAFLLAKRSKAPQISITSESQGTTAAPTKLLTWDDPAGFTFQYPEGMTIDKHDEDMENYAHIEFTDKSHPGSLIVWAKDTTSADVAAWVKTEKSFRDANVIDTTLGGQPAKKILLGGENQKLVIGSVYDELLFTVESTLVDKEYWMKVAGDIAGSFTFKPLEGSGNTSESTGDEPVEAAADEEEVLE